MLSATLAMTALLAAAPTGVSRETASHQDQTPQSSAKMCTHCSATRTFAAKPGWVMTRRDNPHSTVVEDDTTPVHHPTNDEINAAETGNVENVDFRYATAPTGGTGNLDLDALEAENPHYPQPGKRVAVAVASTPSATKCSCMVSDARRAPAGGR